ncbi:MAG: hypothetical protein HXY30_02510 [Pseudorhodoplanes sp.]|nr:hypothetical protein [Pseudorhodoplanes sp.]
MRSDRARSGVFDGRPARPILLAGLLAVAACSGAGAPQGAANATLEKPTKFFVSEYDVAADLPVLDPALAANLKRQLPGLTDDAAQIEISRRVSAAIAEATVAALRQSGIQAAQGGGEILRANEIGLMVSGKIVNSAEGAAQRRPPGAPVVAAQTTLTYYVDPNSRIVDTFTTDSDLGRATAPARRPATAGAPGGTQRLSPDIDAKARGLGRAIAERIVAFAAEKGWIKAPAVPASPRRY